METLKTPDEIKKEISETMEELSWVVEGGDAHDLQDACDKAHACLADTLALIEGLESAVTFHANIAKLNKKSCDMQNELIEEIKTDRARISENIKWMEAERDDLKRYIQQLEAENAQLLEKVDGFSKVAFEQNMVILGKQDVITKQERVRADLQDEIWQLEAKVPRWISVEERLPEGEVLAANFAPGTYGYQEYIMGYVEVVKCTEPDWERDKCYATNDFEILNNVTHWMPLPEPLKEEE